MLIPLRMLWQRRSHLLATLTLPMDKVRVETAADRCPNISGLLTERATEKRRGEERT